MIFDVKTFAKICNREFLEQRPQLYEVLTMLDDFVNSDKLVANVSMPTRFGKSYMSNILSAYLILVNPNIRILRVSYSALLAEQFSEQVRMIYTDFCEKLGYKVKTVGTRGRWKIEGKSQFNHVGCGTEGTLTGVGFDIAIVDDTAKGYAEAVSAAYTHRLDYFLQSVLLGRLEGKRQIINVGTRWSKNDWFSKFNPDVKYILPAMVDGKSVNEKWKTTGQLLYEKEMISGFIWDAQYQQQPSLEGKEMIFEHYYPMYTDAEGFKNDIIVIDPSFSQNGDFFVIGHYAKKDDIVCLIDMFASNKSSNDDIIRFINNQTAEVVYIEANGVGRLWLSNNREKLNKTVVSFVTKDDKYSRAYVKKDAIKTRFYIKKKSLSDDTFNELMRETKEFPVYSHDDLIDNVIMAFERFNIN